MLFAGREMLLDNTMLQCNMVPKYVSHHHDKSISCWECVRIIVYVCVNITLCRITSLFISFRHSIDICHLTITSHITPREKSHFGTLHIFFKGSDLFFHKNTPTTNSQNKGKSYICSWQEAQQVNFSLLVYFNLLFHESKWKWWNICCWTAYKNKVWVSLMNE